MSVDAAFKAIVSMGVVVATEHAVAALPDHK
jgi:uncharacterized membrane protein